MAFGVSQFQVHQPAVPARQHWFRPHQPCLGLPTLMLISLSTIPADLQTLSPAPTRQRFPGRFPETDIATNRQASESHLRHELNSQTPVIESTVTGVLLRCDRDADAVFADWTFPAVSGAIHRIGQHPVPRSPDASLRIDSISRRALAPVLLDVQTTKSGQASCGQSNSHDCRFACL